MKKLLLVALLMLTLVFTVVACQGNKNPDDTTADTTAASDVTKAPEESTKAPDDATKAPEETTKAPEETTEAPEQPTQAPEVPTEEPETEAPETEPAGPVMWDENKDVIGHVSADELRKNGDGGNGVFAPGGIAGWDGVATVDEDITYLDFWGWVALMSDFGSFGYQIDDKAPVYSESFAVEAGDDVKGAAAGVSGSTGASRMLISINVSKLSGEHTVNVLYKDAAGKEVILRTFTVVRNAPAILTPSEAGLVKVNADAKSSDNYSASIAGWLGFGQPVIALGYDIDDGDIIWLEGGINANPEDAVKALAGEHAIRFGIQADLTTVAYGEHVVTFYVRLEDRNMCGFESISVTTSDPGQIGDSSYDFDSATTPDLKSQFNFGQGLAPESCTLDAAPYKMSGINQLILTADGTFRMTIINLKTQNGQAALVFRGNPNPTFGDANYFGHDGNNDKDNPDSLSVGCAGIYVGIETAEDGTFYLRLNVKGRDGDTAIPHVFKVPMTTNNLTIVDNNDTVSFYEGETLLATVDVNGNDKGYATEAIVTLAGGETTTLTDVCCASSVGSDIGFIARSSDMTFDAVTLKKLGTEPAEPAEPAGPVLITKDDERSTVTNISNDELRLIKADNTYDGAFAPGAYADWNGVVTITEGQYIALGDWGWVGMTAETFQFGYILDNNLDVLYMFDAFTFETGDDVKNAAAGSGATNASRFFGTLTTALLPVGEHNVKFVMQQNGAEYVIIRDYTVIVNAAEKPAAENLVIDMSKVSSAGYLESWPAAGYSTPIHKLGYAVPINLGEIDLSKYSAVKITYGCDGSDGTKANFEASSSLAIGLKSEASSYGQATDDNFTGDIAHTDMTFSDKGWASGAREAVVDLSNVDYSGNVWLAVHNPAGTEFAISAIEFIA